MNSNVIPPDQDARDSIESDYDKTLFVEAGAGCGKTEALVGRVINLVTSSDVSLDDVAVITFTNKAAAELRHRIRSRLEELLATSSEPTTREKLDLSLTKLDDAAISTLHRFARRLLTEHSIEAKFPPNFEVLDEISSQVEFIERFEKFLDSLLLDPEWSRTLLIGDALGINPTKDLLPLANELHKNWDLLKPTRHLDLAAIDFEDLIAKGHALALQENTFIGSGDSDSMTKSLEAIRQFVHELEIGFDEIQQIDTLAKTKLPSGKTKGRKTNWADIESLRSQFESYAAEVASVRASLTNLVLRRLTACLTDFILDGVLEQRKLGRLDYHDLLVSAREILNNSTQGQLIRSKVHNKYKYLLIDEFQDTDPIQIEIATLIASPVDITSWTSWQTTPTLPGRLFFVGDPKQSIYRFRRADISLYLDAQEKYRDGQFLLSTNFRSTPEIISWINEVFGKLIKHRDDSQPVYTPLVPIRESAPAGNAVTLLGVTAHQTSGTEKPTADSVHLSEAHDITQTVLHMVKEGWPVNKDGEWKAAKFSDVAVLVPTRSAMTDIQRDFERAGVSYRVASTNNVWRSQEIRDLVMCLRAVSNPSDSLATVSALRSSVYGCGDDDLYQFKIKNSDPWAWSTITIEEHAKRTEGGDPVAAGLAHLAELHKQCSILTPSELIGRIVTGRQLIEQCATRRDPRESLRRFRYVADQARAWSDTANGNLQSFIFWIAQQTAENARSIETVLSEDDDDSVQIMTIHAAKGLEFPIAVVAGLPLQTKSQSGVRVGHAPNTDMPYVKIRKGLETLGFDNWAQAERLFTHDESIRTLYVACTRARDHLVISLHRKEAPSNSETEIESPAHLIAGALTGAEYIEADYSNHREVWDGERLKLPVSRPGLSEWRDRYNKAIEFSCRPRFMSATQIAKSADGLIAVSSGNEIHEPGLLKDVDESELPLQGRGRYGTAIGRAVHGVLQTVDLASGEGLATLARIHAEAEGIATLSDQVADLAASAIASGEIQLAIQNRYWRELHVACPIGEKIVEGYVDLVYETEQGLVVVDYKTDRVEPTEIDLKVDRYRLQGATYAAALEETTRQPVNKVVFAFLSLDSEAICASLPDLREAIDDVRKVIELEGAAGSHPRDRRSDQPTQ
ncbi:MAG: hypothetical protein MB55_08635 [marine actinobacterium MedAcidi-G3]|nr:MAG: hypothetical protein MB55_08635 [marine actinobacterium MedAcidi-G3]